MHTEFAYSRYTRLQVPTLRKETTATNGKRETGERGKREKSKEKRKGVRSGQNNSKSIKMKSHLE